MLASKVGGVGGKWIHGPLSPLFNRLLLHHELHKLVIINPPIPILVRLADHLIDLVVRQLLADAGHDVPQLGGADEAVVNVMGQGVKTRDLGGKAGTKEVTEAVCAEIKRLGPKKEMNGHANGHANGDVKK